MHKRLPLEILPTQADLYPFEGQDFIDCWWEHQASYFQAKRLAEPFVLYPKPLLKGMLHLNELRLAGWNTAWSQDLTDEKMDTFAQLQHQIPWDYFRMTWSEDRASHQAFHRFAEMGLEAVHIPDSPEYVMQIEHGWEGYLKTRSRKTRHNIKEKLALVAPFEPHFESVQGDAEIDAFFEEFFKRHIDHWQGKTGYSYFENPVEQKFLIAWAKRLQQSGHLWLERLYFNQTPVNLNMCIVSGDTFYCLFFINTGEYKEFYPGLVNLYLLAQKAIDMGLSQLNLASGTSFYKRQASNREGKKYSLVVANPNSVRGKFYAGWLQKRLHRLYEAQYGS